MRFLADESCDYRVVVALRAAGHDVVAVCQERPGTPDRGVLDWARRDARIVLAEDKDFGQLVFASQAGGGPGLILMRCPESQRSTLPAAITELVERLGARLEGAFVGWAPTRIRVRKI